MLHHASGVSLFMAWWLTFCSPQDVYWRCVSSLSKASEAGIGLLAAVSSGHAITTWGVDKALFGSNQAASNSFLINVCCGVMSSNGGGIVAEAFGLTQKKNSSKEG